MPTRRRKLGGAPRRRVTVAGVRKLAMALPGVDEGTSYGTPAWRVRKKLFARIHGSEDAVVLRIGFDQRELWMQADDETFYITDHYQDYEMMLVRLGVVRPDDLRDLLEQSWYRCAPKGLRAEFAARSPRRSAEDGA